MTDKIRLLCDCDTAASRRDTSARGTAWDWRHERSSVDVLVRWWRRVPRRSSTRTSARGLRRHEHSMFRGASAFNQDIGGWATPARRRCTHADASRLQPGHRRVGQLLGVSRLILQVCHSTSRRGRPRQRRLSLRPGPRHAWTSSPGTSPQGTRASVRRCAADDRTNQAAMPPRMKRPPPSPPKPRTSPEARPRLRRRRRRRPPRDKLVQLRRAERSTRLRPESDGRPRWPPHRA